MSIDAIGYSKFRYTHKAQRLVVAAKISASWKAMRTIVKLTSVDQKALELSQCAAFLVPAPSSLWSRLRGRADIALAIARALSAETGTPILRPPFAAYTSWRKQTRRRDRQQVAMKQGDGVEMDEPYVLVVDDVITTGYTICKTAAYWPNQPFRYVTFATARRQHGYHAVRYTACTEFAQQPSV